MIHYSYIETDIGLIELVEEKNQIAQIHLVQNKEHQESNNELLLKAKQELQEYFLGVRKSFDIMIKLIGTEFQRKVWNELLKIPYGETASYRDIASRVGNEKAVRAVGGAVHKNPLLIVVPCHRVIGKNGSLTGFACGIEVKEKLLNLENGVSDFFENDSIQKTKLKT